MRRLIFLLYDGMESLDMVGHCDVFSDNKCVFGRPAEFRSGLSQ